MKGRQADTGKGDIWLDTSHRQWMLGGRACCLLPHETTVILGGRRRQRKEGASRIGPVHRTSYPNNQKQNKKNKKK